MMFAKNISIAGLLIVGYVAANAIGFDTMPECTFDKVGKIAYPPNCKLYVECSYGYGWLWSCPHGRVFNPAISDCDDNKAVPDCEDGGFINFSGRENKHLIHT